ncbi:DUF4145 domain-containing protein [Aeromonas caviae]|uniref:DUF4145 domain-containing protein n=1 Tax=Aeromonas caviae TaxID=648 RepID=UPI001C60EBED|nr:DUF4145 domain-containing protein [Aeromonas caviae]
MSSNHLMIMFMRLHLLERVMICPHCSLGIHDNFSVSTFGFCGNDGPATKLNWSVLFQACPSCHKPIIILECMPVFNGTELLGHQKRTVAFPQVRSTRVSAPKEVPAAIATDYNEAALVLKLSAQASAALSRRCLQHLLEDTGLSKNNNLNRAIDEALGKNLPSHIADNLDAVRAIGNFAAHVQKSLNTGEILPVEPHEAEWNLDVLDMLFDFCYVQPAKNAAKRAALDAKLAEVGKPSLK